MAMRPRGRTGSQPPRQPMRQTYGSFRPKSEWRDENDAIVLLIYLPGFVKEQVRVMFTYGDGSTLCLKVQGLRPIATGRWSQFAEVYKVPETCEPSKITSQFERGVLTIVMPKRVVAKQTDTTVADQAKAKSEGPSSQETAGQSTQDKISTAAMEEQGEGRDEIPQKATSEEKSQKGTQEKIPAQEAAVAPPSAVEKQREEKNVEALITSQKPTNEKKTQEGNQDEKPAPKVAADSVEKRREEKVVEATTPQKATGEGKSHQQGTQDQKADGKKDVMDRKADEKKEVVDQKADEKKDVVDQKPDEKKDVVDQKPLVPDKEGTDKSKESAAPKAVDNVKKAEDDLEGKSKEDSIAEKSKEMKDERAAAEEVEGGGPAQAEERQLLINLGTAVLTLVAIVAYISYRIGGKA